MNVRKFEEALTQIQSTSDPLIKLIQEIPLWNGTDDEWCDKHDRLSDEVEADILKLLEALHAPARDQ